MFYPRTLSQKFFCKWINNWSRHSNSFYCSLIKISLHYQTVIDQRLTVCHQLFSWTSFGPSECPINKLIGSEGYQTVWRIPWVPSVQAKDSITEFFSKWTIFEIRHCKKVHFRLCKFSVHFLTTSLSESSSFSRTAQLDFSWFLEMSDQQNDPFASPSDSLSSYITAMCISREPFHKICFTNE